MGWRFCSLKTVPNLRRDEFDCGDDEINRYLKDLVETADEAGFSRTFLMIPETGDIGATSARVCPYQTNESFHSRRGGAPVPAPVSSARGMLKQP